MTQETMTDNQNQAPKRLYLLRHAMAMSEYSDGDKGRKLAPKGKEDAVALGKMMKKQGYIPQVILCSPATRTKETLQAVNDSLNVDNITKSEILYTGSTGDYLYEIQKLDDKYDSALIVAHNPSIYELVILLGGQGKEFNLQRLSEGYQPATLSVIDCECASWAEIQPVENTLSDIKSPIDYNAPARPTRWM